MDWLMIHPLDYNKFVCTRIGQNRAFPITFSNRHETGKTVVRGMLGGGIGRSNSGHSSDNHSPDTSAVARSKGCSPIYFLPMPHSSIFYHYFFPLPLPFPFWPFAGLAAAGERTCAEGGLGGREGAVGAAGAGTAGASGSAAGASGARFRIRYPARRIPTTIALTLT